MINFLISTLVVSGIAVLWRALRMRHAGLVAFLRKYLGFYATAFLCGFCFTFWVSFFYLLVFNPLESWVLPFRYIPSGPIVSFLHFLCSWMALGFVSVTFRFVFVLLKESVDHFTHHINPNPNHSHEGHNH